MSFIHNIVYAVCFLTVFVGFVNGEGSEDEFSVLKQDWCGDDDCYELLGVSMDMDFRQIKQAYNNISLQYHPDKNLNQSQSDKDFYVKVNKAWEILSGSKRAAYDENLRIRSRFDSPRESIIVVVIAIYAILVFVVLQYQKQRHSEYRKAILNHQQIQRYFWDQLHIDLSGHKTAKERKKKKKRKFKKGHKENSTQMDLQKLWNSVSNEQINKAIEHCQILVPGWKPFEPSWKRTAVDIPVFMLWCFTEAWFQLTWQIKYKLLKRASYSDPDREELCRRHFQKTSAEWNALDSKSKNALLDTPGPWRKRSNSRSPSSRRNSPRKKGKRKTT